jgi:hypothetical protein
MRLIIAFLIIAAFIFAVAVLIGSAAFGTFTPHLLPLAVMFLAIALALLAFGGSLASRL